MHCFECSEGQHLHSFHASLCGSELPIKSELICIWAKKSWVGLPKRGRVGYLQASTCLQLLAISYLQVATSWQLLANIYLVAATCKQAYGSGGGIALAETRLTSHNNSGLRGSVKLCGCRHHVSPTCGHCGKHSEAKVGSPPRPFRTTAELLK